MLTDSSNMLQAFQIASGAGQLNLFIRTLVLGGIYCWAVWIIYGFMCEIRHQGVDDVMASLKKVSRVLLLIVFMTILVFIH